MQVPEDYLRELGLTDSDAHGRSVRIPYFDETGAEIGARFRIALEGPDKFRAPKKSRLGLYGISRLNAARSDTNIAIVVGESDCVALWFEGLSAIGLPTPSSWNEARDARYFDGFRRINVVLNPYNAEAMLEWLRQSSIRHRTYLVSLPADNDPAALRLANPMHFEEAWNDALARALSWQDYAQRSALEAREEAKQAAGSLLACPDILEAVADQCYGLGIAGERATVQLVYLVCTTRLLRQIVSLIVKGPSSSGKSFLVKTVLRLIPDDGYLAFTGMSEKALIHTNESLAHRHLVIYEAVGLRGGFLAYLVRTLLSEGHIKYQMPNRQIYKEGPTGLVVTTTEGSLHHENETRCLSLTMDDSRAQTAAIMRRQAATRGERDINPQWHALQRYLALSPSKVKIPYRGQLSREIKPEAIRLRRDFNTLLALISAHALLHQQLRQRDDDGTVIANVEDYRVVRGLVNDILSEGIEIGVSANVRETRQAVADLIVGGVAAVPLPQLARALRLDKSVVSRRVAKAVELGYLRNLETRRGQPARVVLADDIPDQVSLLPEPEVLEQGDKGGRVRLDD
jgi:hypothetical protein